MRQWGSSSQGRNKIRASASSGGRNGRAIPWSEHIAFPGGSRAAGEDALQTLRRELKEEIGWIVEDRQRLVQLPQLRIRLAGRERLLLLDAFVYRVERSPTGTTMRSGSRIGLLDSNC